MITKEQYQTALAWEIYCRETARGMDVRDYWSQLPKSVQLTYLTKADKQAKEITKEVSILSGSTGEICVEPIVGRFARNLT